MTSVSEFCQQMLTADDVYSVLESMGLDLRRAFTIAARYVPEESPRYPLARKILDASPCSPAGKTIVSWNIDSLRSGIVDHAKGKECKMGRKILPTSPMGLLIEEVNPDIICLQETKLQKDHEKCFDIDGFHTYWSSSTATKGYSGVTIWSREEPLRVETGLVGVVDRLNREGRILTAYYPGYVVVNTYVPNTLREEIIEERLQWDAAMLVHLEKLWGEGYQVIWCGDLNVSRSLLDVYGGEMTRQKMLQDPDSKDFKRWKARLKGWKRYDKRGGVAGFRRVERDAIEFILAAGFVDVFRELYPEEYGFTYWSRMKVHFREANNGWRLDYFIVTPELLNCVVSMKVYKDLGVTYTPKVKVPSDHAPIVLRF